MHDFDQSKNSVNSNINVDNMNKQMTNGDKYAIYVSITTIACLFLLQVAGAIKLEF